MVIVHQPQIHLVSGVVKAGTRGAVPLMHSFPLALWILSVDISRGSRVGARLGSCPSWLWAWVVRVFARHILRAQCRGGALADAGQVALGLALEATVTTCCSLRYCCLGRGSAGHRLPVCWVWNRLFLQQGLEVSGWSFSQVRWVLQHLLQWWPP